MDGFVFLLILGLIMMVASRYMKNMEAGLQRAYNGPCKLHKWHPFDGEGWLPDDYRESPRYHGSKLKCQTCLLEPNANTGNKTEDI